MKGEMDRFIRILLLFIFFSLPLSTASATEYYALRLAGSDCTLCHSNPLTGELNPAGTLFRERGYQYPFLWKELFFYLLSSLTFFLIILGFYRRYRLWMRGRSGEYIGQWKRRWRGLLLYGLGHRTVLRSLFPGASHFLLFGSLLILGLCVLIILIQEYLTLPLLNLRFLREGIYPYLRLTLDLFGLLGLIGTLFLAFRRYILKPKELDNQKTDAISLLLLIFVFLTGFLATGIRNRLYPSPWCDWAPIASSAGNVWTIFSPKEDHLRLSLSIFWGVHLFLSFTLLSYIPFSGLFHLISSPLNIFFRNLRPKGALSFIDLENSETFGVERVEAFSWKQLLELDACTRCGRCQENCPAHLTQKHLNPKNVIQNLRKNLDLPSKRGKAGSLIGGVVTEDEIWECTTCRNCLEHCPVFIEPMVQLIEFRRNLALQQGKIPKETQFAFRNIERKGNPWGFERNKRMVWTKALGVREVSPGDKVDILFWVGCYGSYDDRNIKVATALVHILQRAGLDFGVLGNSEWCCGIDLRRMGNEYLFQVAADKNIELLQHVRFKKILTTCPHCFNTLKNEYPQLGGNFEVLHYTTLLEDFIRNGQISVTSGDGKRRITYHDSCYLGRYNDNFEPPRRILEAIPGLIFMEMERNREKAFCCGGGGCHMWMEERAGKRINEDRVEQALKTGAEILATVCPLCMISLDSAVKVLNVDQRIQVMDILELVHERIKVRSY
jgi:Fe-S oxidoreductase/nitrate reductase gamma subunit